MLGPPPSNLTVNRSALCDSGRKIPCPGYLRLASLTAVRITLAAVPRNQGNPGPYPGPGSRAQGSCGGLRPAQLSVTSHSLTSSHSEAKEGDFSSLFFPMLQLDKDSLRLPIVASSVGEQVRRSESDLDKLRLSLSSALGLLVGGTRLLAPLRSPSSSAPPGCGDAV